jgi:hypothetical protein
MAKKPLKRGRPPSPTGRKLVNLTVRVHPVQAENLRKAAISPSRVVRNLLQQAGYGESTLS